MRHDYLRKSIVDRIERKNLVKIFRKNEHQRISELSRKPRKTPM